MPANDLGLYDREADSWWEPGTALSLLKDMNPPRFDYFGRFVHSWDRLDVLDVGCGGGFTCEYLAKRGANVSGIDLSAKSIEVAERHAKESGLDIQYTYGRAEQLPYENDLFDVVVCVDVLEHVSELEVVVSEAYRVLKRGGLFLFDSINKTFRAKLVLIWLAEYLLRKLPKGLHDWNMFIKPEVFVSVLDRVGFCEIDIMGFDIKGRDKKTNTVELVFNANTSVFYIGKGVKIEKDG